MQELSPQDLAYIAGIVDSVGFVKDDGSELDIKTWFSRDLKELLGGIGYNISAADEPSKLIIYTHIEVHREFLNTLLPYLRQEKVATKIRKALTGQSTNSAGGPSEVVCDSCYTPNGHSAYCPERQFGADPGNEDWAEEMGYTASASSPVPETAEESEPDPLAHLKHPDETDDPAACRFCYLQANDDRMEGDRCGTHRRPSDEEILAVTALGDRLKDEPRSSRNGRTRGRDRARQGVS